MGAGNQTLVLSLLATEPAGWPAPCIVAVQKPALLVAVQKPALLSLTGAY